MQCYKSAIAQLATLTECSNELLAHFAVRHPDVALPISSIFGGYTQY